VSLSTGRQVLASLDPARYDAFPIDTGGLHLPSLGGSRSLRGTSAPAAEPAPGPAWPRPDLISSLPAPLDPPLLGGNRPDVALICLHGRFGEDGTIQGMLELLEIPYTGSGVLASALAMDKNMAKKIFRQEGIPTPPHELVRGRTGAEEFLRRLRSGAASIRFPVIVKPSRQGSTIGITVARNPSEMGAALYTALEFDREVLVEQFIEGIEITAPVLGNEELNCLPLVEIVPSSGFYDYEAKYTPGATEEIVPARIPPAAAGEAQRLALCAHRALGCRGFSRTDMLVRGDEVWVLEVNTIPGMTPTSLLPRSAEAAGIAFPKLLDQIIALALEGHPLAVPSLCIQ
jgi:D-alanine-D-alanine ligase